MYNTDLRDSSISKSLFHPLHEITDMCVMRWFYYDCSEHNAVLYFLSLMHMWLALAHTHPVCSVRGTTNRIGHPSTFGLSSVGMWYMD